MKKLIFTLFVTLAALNTWGAKQYCVSSKASGTSSFTVRDVSFQPGVTGFTTFAKALAAAPAGSEVFVDAGTWTEDITITKGVTLLGASAHCENRGTDRASSESILKGTVTIKCSSVTINGFRFTANGRVLCTAGTTAAPLSNIKFIYNYCNASTLGHSTDTPVLRIGSLTGLDNAKLAEHHCRYKNVEVSHNYFAGSDTYPAHFVQLASCFGTTRINGNIFKDGGTSVRINAAQGTIHIQHNQFTNVGNPDRACGDAKGEYAIDMRYCGLSNTTRFYIRNNTFANCQGQSGTYSIIRSYQGSSATARVVPVDYRVYLNHNTFTGKKHTNTSSEFNYIYYQDSKACAELLVDPRFNTFDNSEYAMGRFATPHSELIECYFANSTTMLGITPAYTSGVDYFKDLAGTAVKDYGLPDQPSGYSGICQSFDVDHKTGDIYFLQPWGTAADFAAKTTPMRIWRVYKNADGVLKKGHMTVNNASHGSNFSVARINEKLYAFNGAASDFIGDPAYPHPKLVSFHRYIGGTTANVDGNNTTFTDGTTTYNILYHEQTDKKYIYPGTDVVNRLYCEMSGTGRFDIYDLDDVYKNGQNATMIKRVTIPAGSNPFTSTDATLGIFANADQGYHTWVGQGWTIAGDYIYVLEGVGDGNTKAVTIGGQRRGTIMMTVWDWRRNKFCYRRPVYPTQVATHSNGEPEGVKVWRDAAGRANLLIGFVGRGGAYPNANILQYSPVHANGLGTSFKVEAPVLEAVSNPTAYSTSDTKESHTKTLKVKTTGNTGDVFAVITGPDAKCFNVDTRTVDAFAASHSADVTFTPDKTKRTYNATVRFSTPGAPDVTMALTGNYSGTLTGVEEIVTDDAVLDAAEAPVTAIHDIQGRRLPELRPGLNIVTDAHGRTRKVYVR